MFLQNVGGTFPWPHLVVSSGSPTPSTVTPEKEPSYEEPPAQRGTPVAHLEAAALLLGPPQRCSPYPPPDLFFSISLTTT